MKIKLNFELYNKSDIFIKYKIQLEILQIIYGDNAKVIDVIKAKEFLRR